MPKPLKNDARKMDCPTEPFVERELAKSSLELPHRVAQENRLPLYTTAKLASWLPPFSAAAGSGLIRGREPIRL